MESSLKKLGTAGKVAQLQVVNNKIQKVAFMDVDGTIVDAHSVHYLNLIHKGIAARLFHLGFTLRLMLQGLYFHLLNYLSCDLFDRYYFSLYRGFDVGGVEKAIKEILLPYIRVRIFPAALKEIDELKKQGFHIVLVSASIESIIHALVKELGVDNYIATKMEVKNGCYTGKVSGYTVNHHNKGRAIKEYLERENIQPCKIIAYGNSKWDIPMLNLADESFVINPKGKLLQWVKNSRTKSINWQRNRTPLVGYLVYALLYPFKRQWIEIENSIPKYKGAIIIANHTSYLDHYFIGSYIVVKHKRRVRFLAKKEHFANPISKWLHKSLGAVPIDRNNARSGLKKTLELLQDNELVLMYPEGTRSRSGKMADFKPGVLYAHFKSGCDIVPVGINGAYQLLPTGKFFPRPAKVSLKFGNPVSFVSNGMAQEVPKNKSEREIMLKGLQDKVAKLAEGKYPI